MSLQIWLPLKGNLENKGLGEIDSIQGTPSYRTNGKIGSALELNTKITISCNQLANLSTFTVCFWVHTDDSTTLTNNWADILGFTDISTSGTNGTFRCETCYNNADYKGAHWHDNSTNALLGNLISGTTNHIRSNNIWQHCAVVFSKELSKIFFYTNGELTGEYIHNGGTINSTGTFYLGDTNPIVGAINDVKFYDEALSPMQVKLISQGLVAHYLLNNNNGGMPNLLNGVPKFYGRTGYNPYQLDIINNLEVGKTYTVQFWNVDVSHTGKTASNLGISVYWGGGTINLIHFRGTDFFTNGHADHLTGTFTITSDQAGKTGATNAWLNIYNSVPSADGTKSLTIGNWKLEENSVPTPWSPYADDTNGNIEYDVSGYCNNGIKYNITEYTSDTPRYSLATKFNGTNTYINVGRGGMVRDEITINIWAYMNDWSTYKARLISCTEGGGWNFEPSGSKIHVGMGTGVSSNTYKNTSGYVLADLTSGWHMFTATYDGFTTKQYVDGNFNSSNNAYTTKTPVFYHTSNPILIGTEASSTQNPAGNYFNGYLSDARIYATALSEADIQSLYNNSAFIDSSGNVYSTEYIEE